MDGNGQTPMAGPAHAALTPEEYEAIRKVLAEEDLDGLTSLLASAEDKIARHLEMRAAWIADAAKRPALKAPR